VKKEQTKFWENKMEFNYLNGISENIKKMIKNSKYSVEDKSQLKDILSGIQSLNGGIVQTN
jgi:hypothetical protein